jgi:hypothetical protein
MAEGNDRYEAFMAELRDLLRRYDAEIRMRYGGNGDSKFWEKGPDVLEVQFGWTDTHDLPSCIDKESH